MYQSDEEKYSNIHKKGALKGTSDSDLSPAPKQRKKVLFGANVKNANDDVIRPAYQEEEFPKDNRSSFVPVYSSQSEGDR
jgi:hypothetical protein